MASFSLAPLEPCPHCGSDARCVPHAVYRYRCDACGKPRIPFDGQPARSDIATVQSLNSAHKQRLAKIAWQWAGLGAGFLGCVALLFTALFSLWVTWGWTLAFALFSLVPWALALTFWLASRRAATRSQAELERAWQQAAQTLYGVYGPTLTAETLAQKLGIDVEQATHRLAEAEVSQWLSAPGRSPLRVDPGAVNADADTVLQEARAELDAELAHGSTLEPPPDAPAAQRTRR